MKPTTPAKREAAKAEALASLPAAIRAEIKTQAAVKAAKARKAQKRNG